MMFLYAFTKCVTLNIKTKNLNNWNAGIQNTINKLEGLKNRFQIFQKKIFKR